MTSPGESRPTNSDLSDSIVIKAIDTQIAKLQRVKPALLTLRENGDFSVRTVLVSDLKPRIDVFRRASADDVAIWNKNEFKLGNGRVGADQIFCAAIFEDLLFKWSEIRHAEKKVDGELKGGTGLLKF
jgi:hypothetical protein